MANIPSKLVKTCLYVKEISLKDNYVQIPILSYSPGKLFNDNPYISLINLRRQYEEMKGKVGEEEFWRGVEEKYKQGFIEGFEHDKVYEFQENRAFAVVSENQATHVVWFESEIDQQDLDDTDWNFLEDNTERKELCIDNEPTNNEILVYKIKNIIRS